MTRRMAGSVRRGATLALAAALLAGGAPVAAARGDVRLPGLTGGQLSDADLERGATILVVWASWSPRCRDIAERANAIAARWGGSARVVTVNFQEDAATITEFLRGKGLQPPVFLDRDGEFSKSHSVTTLPGLVVIRDGQVRYEGKLPADADATLRDLLK